MCSRLENLSGRMVKAMTTSDEVREFLAAVPRQHTDTRDSWLRRAAGLLGLTPRRARSVWYREKVRIDHDEYVRMRARIEGLRQSQIKRREIMADVHTLVGARVGLVGSPTRSGSDNSGTEIREGSTAPGRAGEPPANG